MDIVDTFNHLIPTEHLDDALFLGSNLENEVCEDFSTSQNVLEDSLKNMLSDKDPMLGSASNQFCLPVLDSNDPNFQMPCSTVVGLDDIMDEGVVKESGNDTIDEEELILPNRNLRDRVEDNSVRSPRKSPRLMAQGNPSQEYKHLKCRSDPYVKIEGKDTDDWLCVDFGSMVIHLMLPETRETYELEKLWTLRSFDDQLAQIAAETLPEDFILGLENDTSSLTPVEFKHE